MRPVLATIRYPDSRAEGAEYRQTAPTVGVKLLATMTSYNGIEQVFEGGDTKSVTRLHQGRRTDDRFPVVIGEDQMQMVTYRVNGPVAQERHAEHQPHCPFRGELPATNRSGSCRCKGLRHQRSVKTVGEGVEVIKWLIAGRGQQCGAKMKDESWHLRRSA